MSRLLAIVALVALACSAYAGGNPDIRIYIDFDPPNYVSEIEADIYTMIDAYVCMDSIGEGMTGVSFAMNDPSVDFPGVVVVPTWSPYLMPPP
jgi:hypothetical protein